MAVALRVVPCLDVDAGRVVKGVNFENLRDAGDPVELARRYDAEGADEVTFLDVSASSGDRETTYDVVRRTAEEIFVPLTVGGGVRSADDVDRLLRAGADKVGVNTAAIARPELIAEIAARFGSQVLVLSVDARRVTGRHPDRLRLRGHHARRPARHRDRRRRLGGPGRRARRGGDPAQLHGRRRDHGRLRPARCCGPCAARCASRSSRAAGPARPSTSSRRRRPAPTRCSRRACSTSATLTVGQVKDALRAAGVVVR